ncbi:MAG: hypothetical protein L6R41_005677 [Letrouitia leprolyta]|nr:MAG: hypothetical protein L6R41_005677 [Letrouitia leprolyta]
MTAEPAQLDKANGSIATQDLHTSAAKLSIAENATVDGSTDPVKTPFINPSSASKLPNAPSLTSDQSTKYESLLALVTSWTLKHPPTPTTPAVPISDSDRMWLTRECLLRYLRATKWDVQEAANRLQATLIWRHQYGLEKHTPEYISPENATGKQVIQGYDNAGRPCLYLNPGKQNTERSNKQVEHLVFMLERTLDLMPPGQETLSLLINFDKKMGGDRPPLWQGKQVLNILQSHYPERLGMSLVINSSFSSITPRLSVLANSTHQTVHWVVWTFFKLINPFIDPATREKLKFDQDLRQFVPPSQLLKTHGGEVNFEYNHDVYWPALNELAAKKKVMMVERWENAGKKIGESEYYLRGGEKAVGNGVVENGHA